MKTLLIKSSALIACLSLFAFSSANDVGKIDYKLIHQFDNVEVETSSFDQFETRTYTPSKAVYEKRVRYWTDFQSNFNKQNEISEVLERN